MTRRSMTESPATVQIRDIVPADAAVISGIGIRSKAHWGYTPEQMQVFREELTHSEDDLHHKSGEIAETGGAAVGFYLLHTIDAATIELECLFIEPTALKSGYGSTLFRRAVERARELGFPRMTIQSDPFAAGFYERHHARKLRDIPSSIPGRTIPFFEYDLVAHPLGAGSANSHD